MEILEILENYQRTLSRVYHSAKSVQRDPANIRMVVVTKTHPVEVIRALVENGIRYIGESYLDEVIRKIELLPDLPGIEWHMVGHIQSRKGKSVCQHIDYIHSLDSLKLANIINQQMSLRGLRMPVLLECNVSGEESKYGFPAWKDEHWLELSRLFTQINHLPYLDVKGLMTIAPLLAEAEATRPYFRRLRHLRDFLQDQIPEVKLTELSMGMSADFEIAIQEGATWIRIGQSILGPRYSG